MVFSDLNMQAFDEERKQWCKYVLKGFQEAIKRR